MRLRTLLFLLALAAGSSIAVPLTGSGTNLPMPGATGSTPPGIVYTLVQGSGNFTATWTAPAPAAWIGTINGTGDYPCCGNAGTSTWSFGGLANGYLPTGTYFRLGDVDNSETLSLTAYDQFNQVITTPWLDLPIFVSSPNPGDILQANLPGWAFASGTYTFNGYAGVNGNTLLTVTLPSNMNIYGLVVNQPNSNAGFGLSAPDVPEPGTYALMGGALGALALYKRRSRS